MLVGIFPVLLSAGLFLAGAPADEVVPMYLIPGLGALVGGFMLLKDGGLAGRIIGSAAWIGLAFSASILMYHELHRGTGYYEPKVAYGMLLTLGLYVVGAVAVVIALVARARSR
jgi:hypothetical protein